MIKYLPDLIILIKISFFLPQSEIDQFEPFNFKESICINYKDPQFPPFDTFIYEKHTDPTRLPLAFVGRDYKNDTASLFASTFYMEAYDIFHVHNGYIGDNCIVAMEGNYLLDVYNSTKKVESKKRCNYPTNCGFRHVLAAITPWTSFGHFINDIIGPLMLIEEYIWDLDPVFCCPPFDASIVRQYLDIAGHSNIKYVQLKNQMIFAENLYVIRGKTEYETSGFYTLNILRRKIFSYYNLSAVQPNDYGYMNKHGQRHFTNLKELIETLEQENENVSFKFVSVNSPDRTTYAKTMATFKLFISPCGSIAYNMIFMHENTGYITLSSLLIDFPNLKTALDINIFLITITHRNMWHFRSKGDANIKRVSYCFKILQQAIQQKKWPNDHKLFLPFNENYYREKVGKDPDYTLEVGQVVGHLYYEYMKNYSLPDDIP